MLTAISVFPAEPARTQDLLVPKSKPTSTVVFVFADEPLLRAVETLGALEGMAAAGTGFSAEAGIIGR